MLSQRNPMDYSVLLVERNGVCGGPRYEQFEYQNHLCQIFQEGRFESSWPWIMVN